MCHRCAGLGRHAGGPGSRDLRPFRSQRWRRGTYRRLRGVEAEVRQALPVQVLRGRTRRDMRNHRKLFVIDGRVGFAGSLNLVAKDFRPGIVNRKLVARVSGPAVASKAPWSRATGVSKPEESPTIRLWSRRPPVHAGRNFFPAERITPSTVCQNCFL